jgi:hypothetical protein
VLKPESPRRVRILRLLHDLRIGVDLLLVLPVLRLLVGLFLLVLSEIVVLVLLAGNRRGGERRGLGGLEGFWGRHRRAVAVPVAVRTRLGLGQQRGQSARECVDLVGREDCAVGEVWFLLGEQALEPEQQSEGPAPLHRGQLGIGFELGERCVERASARRSGGEGLGGGLAFVYESLARELLGTRNRVSTRKGGGSTHAILEG